MKLFPEHRINVSQVLPCTFSGTLYSSSFLLLDIVVSIRVANGPADWSSFYAQADISLAKGSKQIADREISYYCALFLYRREGS